MGVDSGTVVIPTLRLGELNQIVAALDTRVAILRTFAAQCADEDARDWIAAGLRDAESALVKARVAFYREELPNPLAEHRAARERRAAAAEMAPGEREELRA